METVENVFMHGIQIYLKNEIKKLSKKNDFIQKEDDEYDIVITHRILTHFRYQIQHLLKEKIDKTIHTQWTLEEFASFEYFYIFYHESICVYFFCKNGIHHIFFEGLHKWSDFKNINLIKWIQHKKIVKTDGLLKKGRLIKIHDCYMTPFMYDHFFHIFSFVQKNHYKKEGNKIPLIVEGYSLGGVYLQLFLELLYEKNIYDQYKINAYQIESWFQGGKDEYNAFQKRFQVKNMMKYGSYFHLINHMIQKYRKIDLYIKPSKEMEDILESELPLRMVEYGVISHML
jgi:hypothetical protein